MCLNTKRFKDWSRLGVCVIADATVARGWAYTKAMLFYVYRYAITWPEASTIKVDYISNLASD
jgi:hypothetical protein